MLPPLRKEVLAPFRKRFCSVINVLKRQLRWTDSQPAAPQAEDLPASLLREPFTSIGTGCFGDVYALGNSDTVLKVAKDSVNAHLAAEKLKLEEQLLRQAQEWAAGTSIQIPRSYGFHTSSSTLRMPFMAMQRIPELHPNVVDKLRRWYHPESWGSRPVKLWRLYMGLDRVPDMEEFFGGGDYPLLCNEAEAIGLPLKNIARDMGKFTARMTYAGGWLPNDVEFLLGGPELQVYCLDFGCLNQHSQQVDEIVASLYNADPYYPQRPDHYRDEFAEGYVSEAGTVGKAGLASLVMEELHARWYADRYKFKIS